MAEGFDCYETTGSMPLNPKDRGTPTVRVPIPEDLVASYGFESKGCDSPYKDYINNPIYRSL